MIEALKIIREIAEELSDDKKLVILAVLIICVIHPDAGIVDNALTGLFGIAVGKSMK